MFSSDNWKEIFETIQKNKLRTFLSGFTVALGILIFVVLFGFGNGLINTFNESFPMMRRMYLWFLGGEELLCYKGYKANRNIEFDNSDLADIEKNFPLALEYLSPRITRQDTVSYRNESNSYATWGG